MPSRLPFRSIAVPPSRRSPKAPPLYRWDDEDEETSVVTLDPALRSRTDRAPKLPFRRQVVNENDSSRLQKNKHQNHPPRRPRRSTSPSPPRNPYKVDIANVPLKPVKFAGKYDQFKIQLDESKPLNRVMSDNTDSTNKVSLVFCIRRTGCAQCRGHAMQLASLVEDMEDVSLIGVIKPEAVAEDRLLQFYADYFPFPLYQDDDWNLFTALGNRKLSTWSLFKNAPKLVKRYHEQNIMNLPFGGDIYTLGGLMIFDQEQRLKFVYYEKYGDELDTAAIVSAIEEAKRPFCGTTVPASSSPPLPFQNSGKPVSNDSFGTLETEDLTGSSHTSDKSCSTTATGVDLTNGCAQQKHLAQPESNSDRPMSLPQRSFSIRND